VREAGDDHAAAGLTPRLGEPPNRASGGVVRSRRRSWTATGVDRGSLASLSRSCSRSSRGGRGRGRASSRSRTCIPPPAVVAVVLVAFATTSRRMLLRLARDVVAASGRDLELARELFAQTRRPGRRRVCRLARCGQRQWSQRQENLADGLLAPCSRSSPQAPLGLAAGAGAVAWVKEP